MRNPTAVGPSFVFGFKFGLCIIWFAPFGVLGFLLAITIVGIPLAMVVWAAGAAPLYWVVKKRSAAVYAWRGRDQVLPQEEEVPWETT